MVPSPATVLESEVLGGAAFPEHMGTELGAEGGLSRNRQCRAVGRSLTLTWGDSLAPSSQAV